MIRLQYRSLHSTVVIGHVLSSSLLKHLVVCVCLCVCVCVVQARRKQKKSGADCFVVLFLSLSGVLRAGASPEPFDWGV